MSLTTMRMEELRGTLMLVLEPNFIATMTNSIMAGLPSHKFQTHGIYRHRDTVIELVTSGLASVLQPPGAT